MAQTSHICSIYHVFEIYIHLQMYNTHEYMEYLRVLSIRILVSTREVHERIPAPQKPGEGATSMDSKICRCLCWYQLQTCEETRLGLTT